ncbi:PREDICTED: uncharacterized protein LOC104809031 [Tarenaya hassleriana]|uniref:uncharacterized protein LOC104809031 n=1 Tax=Tarenaya hassleriana TaxID=28532 RepID=UPI00053CA235|nr:PREDICTED: uncharacterized protein LOC104809031 [Tarenaya hassleriana]
MSVGGEDRDGGAAEEEAVAAGGSPRGKVKFLCSYGGKILPRPSDGALKYVGGETRVVAVARDVSFSELMKKVTALTESQIVLKYQIIAEDLDALVTVKSDEDLKHMIEEHDRHESAGIPKLRTFLFPSTPLILENHHPVAPTESVEQRYIEAINGVIRIPIKTRPSFSISASSSPKSESPEGNGLETSQLPENAFQSHGNYHLSQRYPMHKVQSSPNICGGGINLHLHPAHHHHYQTTPPLSYLSCRLRPLPPLDLHKGAGHGWAMPIHGLNQNQPYATAHTSGSGHRSRASSVPQSPRNHGLRL